MINVSVKDGVLDCRAFHSNVNYRLLGDLKQWCRENAGLGNWDYGHVPFEFRFNRSEDALAFKLKFVL